MPVRADNTAAERQARYRARCREAISEAVELKEQVVTIIQDYIRLDKQIAHIRDVLKYDGYDFEAAEQKYNAAVGTVRRISI